jgi:hypothetical protein
VIVKLDVIDIGQDAAGKIFIDEHVVHGFVGNAIHAPRGPTDLVTLRPGFHGRFAERRANKDKGMARAIGGHWPRRFAVVFDLYQDRVQLIAQPHRAGLVGE